MVWGKLNFPLARGGFDLFFVVFVAVRSPINHDDPVCNNVVIFGGPYIECVSCMGNWAKKALKATDK